MYNAQVGQLRHPIHFRQPVEWPRSPVPVIPCHSTMHRPHQVFQRGNFSRAAAVTAAPSLLMIFDFALCSGFASKPCCHFRYCHHHCRHYRRRWCRMRWPHSMLHHSCPCLKYRRNKNQYISSAIVEARPGGCDPALTIFLRLSFWRCRCFSGSMLIFGARQTRIAVALCAGRTK